jgi:hypothetical protein
VESILRYFICTENQNENDPDIVEIMDKKYLKIEYYIAVINFEEIVGLANNLKILMILIKTSLIKDS